MEELVPALLQLISKQAEQIIELSRVVAEHRVAPEPEPVVLTPTRPYPLHVPETEEDARAAYESGAITREQLQDVLKEIEFFNAEITVPTPGV
ncbi:MAG: hypothetical protein KGL39_49935 [Patescibacteria group bacterium]|nr:hypothetical protein [Patescibacteria group bacterium]